MFTGVFNRINTRFLDGLSFLFYVFYGLHTVAINEINNIIFKRSFQSWRIQITESHTKS